MRADGHVDPSLNATRPVSKSLTRSVGAGGNSPQVKLWKRGLRRLANEISLTAVVSRLPPGGSKWNKTEHRLFAFTTTSWRDQPLVSHQVIVPLIDAAPTQTESKVC